MTHTHRVRTIRSDRFHTRFLPLAGLLVGLLVGLTIAAALLAHPVAGLHVTDAEWNASHAAAVQQLHVPATVENAPISR